MNGPPQESQPAAAFFSCSPIAFHPPKSSVYEAAPPLPQKKNAKQTEEKRQKK